ncbi:hypothetical protein TorRG33x02_145780, partial [Trema orientale]
YNSYQSFPTWHFNPYQDGEHDQDVVVVDGAAKEAERLVKEEGPDGDHDDECDERDEC